MKAEPTRIKIVAHVRISAVESGVTGVGSIGGYLMVGFPNKMTLCPAMNWWFLVDEVKEVCPLWYLTSADLHNCKNGRRNLSNLKTIMTTLIDECKKGVYVDKQSPGEINKMYRAASGLLLSLTDNPRAET